MNKTELDGAELDAKIEKVKQMTLNRIFGLQLNDEPEPEIEKRVVDFKFGTGRSWLNENRLTSNNDTAGLGEINAEMHACNGHIER